MKHSQQITGLCLFFLLLSLTARSQDVITPVITSDPKDFGGRVNALFQDRTGFIWIGKETGLFRYDGYQLKTFRHTTDSNSIGNDNIQCFAEDMHGNLWVGTKGGGLNRYDKEKNNFTRFLQSDKNANSISYNEIFTIKPDSTGNLWIGTDGGGLDYYDIKNNKFTHYRQDNSGLKSNKVLAIHDDNQGNLWLGTWDGGLHRMDIKTGKIIHIKGNQTIKFSGRTAADLNIFKIAERKPGILWLATWGQGLIAFHIREQVFEEIIPAYKIAAFRDLKPENNQMWAASVSGLVRFDQKNNFEIIPEKSGIFDHTSALFFDRTGILWVGKENGSVGKINFTNKNFTSFPPQSPLGRMAINAITVGTDSDQVFAAYGNKLTIANHLSKKTVDVPYDDIVSVAVFPGRIITASSQGLSTMKPGDKKSIPLKLNDSLLTNRQIWTIYKETDTSFWLGILGAAVKLTYKNTPEISEIFFTGAKNGINPSHYPACFLKDSRGNLWIGTFGGGLNVMKPDRTFGSFLNSENKTRISDNFVECLLEDRLGNIWIGTRNGLDCYNPVTSAIKSYTLSDGLQNSWIASLEEDNHGNIWFSTHGGVSCIRKDGTIRNYNTDDGLPSNYFLPRSSSKLKNGSLWFGSNQGLLWFFPDSVSINHHLPQPVITSFRVNNHNSDVIQQVITINNKDFLSFQFSALQYFNPKKNRYRFMLKGYDTSWQIAGEDRTANYRNIKPGRYIFTVAASNDDGLWSEKEAQLKIVVRRSFPALIIIIFAGLIAAAVFAFFFSGFKRKAQPAEVKTGKPQFRVVQPSEVPYSSAEEVFLQKALKIVEDNLSDPNFGVEELCLKICISRPQLYRKIQAVTGLSVTEFIKEIRLKRAAQLLKQKPENISEIAYSVGFNDPKYFSKCFRNKFGMSPARFINEHER